jgi:anaerobic magnesium-protoporphyrin IX monomethyl ester cyclase
VAAAGVIKAELFTDEQAGAMYAAGFRWILVGFESGSSRILET